VRVLQQGVGCPVSANSRFRQQKEIQTRRRPKPNQTPNPRSLPIGKTLPLQFIISTFNNIGHPPHLHGKQNLRLSAIPKRNAGNDEKGVLGRKVQSLYEYLQLYNDKKLYLCEK
jgi:hypothetical protein